MSDERTPTEVDALADRYLDEFCALDPLSATSFGVSGHDDRLPDLSPDGHAERSQLRRRTLAALAATAAVDTTDAVTIAALGEELELAEQLRAAGADLCDLNVIASPPQSVRDVFDLMNTDTADDWATIATRLSGSTGGACRLHRVASRCGSPGRCRCGTPGTRRRCAVCRAGRPRRLLRPVRPRRS